MLLFREIRGWVQYLISKDPICQSNGVVVEEIYSTFAPFSDVNDGVRTLVIHKVQLGMTPRLEMRFTGLRPQIFWYPPNATEGELLQVTNQSAFPGDYKSWDCSDTCQWLLLAARSRLCNSDLPAAHSCDCGCGCQVDIFPAVTASCNVVIGKKILDLDIIKKIIDAIGRSVKKGNTLTRKSVNDWLKENESADLHDFALSLMHWFDRNKITWKDLDLTEDEYTPGRDIVDWSWLKRNLDTPERLGKLPPPIVDRVKSENSVIPANVTKRRLDDILRCFVNNSQPLPPSDTVRFGQSVISHFKSGTISLPYLHHLELADPQEKVLPWSLIRRSILSYNKKALAETEAKTPGDLGDKILTWLKDSQLLLPLYESNKNQQEALEKAILAQIQHFVKNTLGSNSWLKAVLSSCVDIKDDTELRRALQVEFDMWLLDALSPAVDRWKLPLSPYAFSIEKKEQRLYDDMFSVWMDAVQDFLKRYKTESQERLVAALSSFFSQVIDLWDPESLKNYDVKTPSASKILNAIETGKPDELLNLLVEDFENELGTKLPDTVRVKLLNSPYFSAIQREVGLQGLRLS